MIENIAYKTIEHNFSSDRPIIIASTDRERSYKINALHGRENSITISINGRTESLKKGQHLYVMQRGLIARHDGDSQIKRYPQVDIEFIELISSYQEGIKAAFNIGFNSSRYEIRELN